MKIKFNFKSLENAMEIAGAELKFTYNLVNQNQNVVSTKKKFNKDGLLKNTEGIKLLNYGGLIFFNQVLIFCLEKNSKAKRKFHFNYCKIIADKFETHYKNFQLKLPESKDLSENFEGKYIICDECLINSNWDNFVKADDWARRIIKGQFNHKLFYDHVYSFEREIHNELIPKDKLKILPPNFSRVLEVIKAKKKWKCDECNLDCSGFKRVLHIENHDSDISSTESADYKSICLKCLKKSEPHIFFDKTEIEFFEKK